MVGVLLQAKRDQLWGYGDRAELEGAGARHLAASPAELERLVL
jgi:hypothetical protein